MAVTPGDQLGPYEITDEIGLGGMGRVFKAKDTRLDRTVAIKVMRDRFAADGARLERFQREARAISQLNHANICTLHDVGEHDGTHFLVMEYVEGETLAHRLERGALPLEQALRHGAQIADALARAHRDGVVHRDLKPGNVMLTTSGVKLLDFGLAKISEQVDVESVSQLQTRAAEPLTEEGSLLGTVQYMAPEQLDGLEADSRSDIFAFGAVLYEMTTGTPAFAGRTKASLIAAIMSQEPSPMTELQALTPPALEALVHRCLAKDPDNRWQSAADLAHQLRWITTRGQDDETGGGQVEPAGRGRMLLAAAAIAVTAMAVITAMTVVSSWRPLATEAPTYRVDLVTPPETDFRSLAMAPDGRTVAFVAPFEGASHIWLRSLETGVAEPVAGTADGSLPFWSPDGRSLGFFADQALQRIDLDGNIVTRLADAPVGNGGAWSENGVIVFAPTVSGGLFRVPADGGAVTQVTQREGRTRSDALPVFLPGGRSVLHRVGTGGPGDSAYMVSDLESGAEQRLFEDMTLALYDTNSGQLLYGRQTALFARPFDPEQLEFTGEPAVLAEGVLLGSVATSAAGPIAYRAASAATSSWMERNFVWFDRQGNEIDRFGRLEFSSNMNAPDLALSPDGRTLAFHNARDSRSGFLDVESGIVTPVGRRIFTVWRGDGSSYFYGDSPAATYDLYEQPARGGDPVLLHTSERNDAPLDVSPDGRFLLFRALDPVAGYSIWALPLDGSGDAFAVVESTDAVDRDGEFSPDGHWIAFESNRNGAFEIFVQPFPGPGAARQVSIGGGTQVRWRSDGEELFYIAPGNRMMAVPITVPPEGDVPQSGRPAELFRTEMVTSAGWQRQQYEVSADGQRFLMPVAPFSLDNLPITLLLNLRSREE